MDPKATVLPPQFYGVHELHSLQRALEDFEERVLQTSARQATGQQVAQLAAPSILAQASAQMNLEMNDAIARSNLAQFLSDVAESAPTIHISLAAEPSLDFLVKITAWLRSNIHPQVLIQVGLQPSIAAGCIIRTSNKVFDFSLRDQLKNQSAAFVQALESGAKQ